MKRKLVICFIALSSVVNAQQDSLTPSAWENIHKKNIKTTHYVFEGIVTKQIFYNSKEKERLTCNIIQIGGIYCDDLQQNSTVKVITKGEHIDKDSNFIPSGREGYFSKGEHCIFFCKRASPDMIVDSLPKTNNAIVLTTMDSASVIVFTNKGVQWDYTAYSFRSLVSFFYKNNRYEISLTPEEE